MKKYVILAAVILLAIGFGSFQYWAIGWQGTVDVSIGTVQGSVNISTNVTPLTLISNIVPGRPFKLGDTDTYLYNITLPVGYNGYYIVTLYLANAGELGEDLEYLLMNVTLSTNATNGTSGVVATKWLSLDNGRVQFKITSDNISNTTGGSGYIYIVDGSGKALVEAGGSIDSPKFVINVEEIGAGQ